MISKPLDSDIFNTTTIKEKNYWILQLTDAKNLIGEVRRKQAVIFHFQEFVAKVTVIGERPVVSMEYGNVSVSPKKYKRIIKTHQKTKTLALGKKSNNRNTHMSKKQMKKKL